MRTQIFISYRRDGGLDAAKHIHGLLQDSYEVFFDMESLRSGRFDINIENAIGSCTDFLLILSQNVFSRFDEDGDWISRELSLALEQGKNIIPVFLDGFEMPDTSNSTINELLSYNGIKLSEESFCHRLKSFLKSNIRCVLKLQCTEEGYLLSPEAVEVLKEIYRNTVKNREFAVQVRLMFPDVSEACEMLVPAETEENRALLLEAKKQSLLGRQQHYHEDVELAIEYMIGDEVNVSLPGLSYALTDKPLYREYYTDKDGRTHSYATVCIWQSIINELLKEFTCVFMNRLTEYSNRRDKYETIDCIINGISKDDKRNWYFISHAKKEEITESVAYYQFMRCSVLELSPETLLTAILPDFYYNVAQTLQYTDNERLKEALLTPDAPIRHLMNYRFGLH